MAKVKTSHGGGGDEISEGYDPYEERRKHEARLNLEKDRHRQAVEKARKEAEVEKLRTDTQEYLTKMKAELESEPAQPSYGEERDSIRASFDAGEITRKTMEFLLADLEKRQTEKEERLAEEIRQHRIEGRQQKHGTDEQEKAKRWEVQDKFNRKLDETPNPMIQTQEFPVFKKQNKSGGEE